MTMALPPFQSAHASGTHWADITRRCLDLLGSVSQRDTLGFVYVTDHLANDLAAIIDQLRLRTGLENWIGTVGIAIIGNAVGGACREYIDEPAISLMVGAFASDGFRLLEPTPGGSSSRLRSLEPWFRAQKPTVAVIHGDPRDASLPRLMHQLAGDGDLFLLGGLSSSRRSYPQAAGSVGEGGISGALFAGGTAIVSALSQGCSPIGPQHRVTRAENNLVMEIDGLPALDVLKQEVGEILSRNLDKTAGFIFAGLPVKDSDLGDYLVRPLIGFDVNRGWLAIGATVASGDSILFARRDRASAVADLNRILGRLKQRINRPVRGGIYVSCIARGPNLFGTETEETALILQQIGDFPLTGFFANGEISRGQIYAHTGVLTLFL